MQMLTKFESKTSRVKGVAFHPVKPWLLVSLHNGTIQLWDFRMGSLMERYEEHNGPVRSVAFHPTQPLFVSGGDDYKIKVWNYKSKKCLFTLNGHLDYVRTVSFHHEHPWILSCSDDQTIRIWNWQSRQCIGVLTGHNHYVMCAAFHPKEDLVGSASLDQTVRIWDISGLRKKHAAPSTMSFEDQIAKSAASTSQQDMFGNTDGIVKFVLEGHERGVNWVAFHPTLPLVLSAGDDRVVRLWRINGNKAWEVDVCRGHYNNVSAAIFDPRQDLILSVSEDKTLRVWDLNKRVGIQNFKCESERFWIIAAHPTINLFAAGHDGGVMVFKLNRERPAYALHQNHLFWVLEDKQVHMIDLDSGETSSKLISLKKFGSQWTPIRTLSYNPAEKSVLATSMSDGGIYELVNLPRDGQGIVDAAEGKRGEGAAAVWVTRNRFAVLSTNGSTIEIKDLANAVTKTIKAPEGTRTIFASRPGTLLVATKTKVFLMDIQKREIINELTVQAVRYVSWSPDSAHVALLGKHYITVATKDLEEVVQWHETIRVKSAAWDESGVLIYTTLNHIKFALMNGDTGIIRTAPSPLYLVRVKGLVAIALDRKAQARMISIDPTEYRFKLALLRGKHSEMLRIIRNSNLVGQSIIAYLQQKGYPEIALNFVQDTSTRFELAIQCGNLDVALETARELDRPEIYTKLATEALRQGSFKTTEICYQKLKNFDRLSFLYLITGDRDKLNRMKTISQHREDYLSIFQNSLYLGDVTARIQMLKECDMYPLAYALAKVSGLEDEAAGILEACGVDESTVKLPTDYMSKLSGPLKPVNETFAKDMPIRATEETAFEKALAAQMNGLEIADDVDEKQNGDFLGSPANADLIDVGMKGSSLDASGEANGQQEDADEDGENGWGGDEDIEFDEALVEVPDAQDDTAAAVPLAATGNSEAEYWVRNSSVPAHHVAAGSFESAMQLLHRQLGVVEFSPLKPRFMEIYQSSKVLLPTGPLLPSLPYYLNSAATVENSQQLLPLVGKNVDTLSEHDLQEAYRLVKKYKLPEAIASFTSLLYSLALSSAASNAQAQEVENMVSLCAEYIVALSCELERTQLPAGEVVRGIELACYFAASKLQKTHQVLALRQAMNVAFKGQNFATASSLASKLLSIQPSGPTADSARKIMTAADRNPNNTHEIDFDMYADLSVCAGSRTPIYKSTERVVCVFCKAAYKTEFKNSLCRVCKVSRLGAPATGRRLVR